MADIVRDLEQTAVVEEGHILYCPYKAQKEEVEQELWRLRHMLYVSDALGPWRCEDYEENDYLDEEDKSTTRIVLEKFCQEG